MPAGAPAVTLQRPDAPWACTECGAGVEASCLRPRPGICLDAELVVGRLEQAGMTLLAMRDRSPYPPPYRCALPEPVREAIEAYGWEDAEVRPAIPSSADITRADITFAWLALIPQHRYVLRRIVASRALVSPTNGRHILGWRRLARLVRADHHAIQRWHAQGIEIIINALTNVPN